MATVRSRPLGAGLARKQLWAPAKRRLKRAISQGFWLEAVALEESMITDRLESMLALEAEPRGGFTLEGALREVSKSYRSEDDPALWARVRAWKEQRNRALHEMVKYLDDHRSPWRDRLRQAREAAFEGRVILDEVDARASRAKRSSK